MFRPIFVSGVEYIIPIGKGLDTARILTRRDDLEARIETYRAATTNTAEQDRTAIADTLTAIMAAIFDA